MNRLDRYGEPIADDDLHDDDDVTAAAQVRHILHQTRTINHAPNCEHPGTTTTPGHSVNITTCNGCGALTTTRRAP